jgi:predicted O-methyltransferase YrrM
MSEGIDKAVPVEPAMDISSQVLETTKKLVSYLKGEAPLTDQAASVWLDSVRTCLTRLAAGESVDWGPEATTANFNALSRFAAARLLRLYEPMLGPKVVNEFSLFVNSGPRFVERGPYRFSFDCFSSRIESWRADLSRFVGGSDLQFLEIGSLEGNSACWLLENILTGEDVSLTCIDPFPGTVEAKFDANIARTRSTAKLVKLKGRSRDILPSLAAEGYDFIYVDGCHHQVSVLEDEIFSWRLLRPRGIMILDDYTLRKNPIHELLSTEIQRPDKAIDAFLSIYEGRYELIRISDQVTLRKL